MILAPHIIVGATIGAKTQDLGLIVILALLTHFIMDKLPHWDYQVSKNFENFRQSKSFKYLLSPVLKMTIDGLIGILIVFLIIWQKNLFNLNYLPFILLGIFISLLPDIILGSVKLFASKSFSKKYTDFHYKFLHCKKEKEGKITFLGLATEILVVIIISAVLLNL